MNSTAILMSPADVAAHEAASYVRSNRGPAAGWDDGPVIPKIPGPRQPSGYEGDSDPDADELLKRARNPRGNWTICPECGGSWSPSHPCASSPRVADALFRLEVEAAYLERDREGLAAYAEYVAEVAA